MDVGKREEGEIKMMGSTPKEQGQAIEPILLACSRLRGQAGQDRTNPSTFIPD